MKKMTTFIFKMKLKEKKKETNKPINQIPALKKKYKL